jgi:nitrogen fixation NifU-like protein
MREDLYDEHILRHFREPYHRGRVQIPTIAHENDNPMCGDRVHLELVLDENLRIREAWFEGHGCAISQAAASILVRHVEGRTIPELNAFQTPQMLQLLGVRLTASRQRCGLLAFQVFQTMLRTLQSRTQPGR